VASFVARDRAATVRLTREVADAAGPLALEPIQMFGPNHSTPLSILLAGLGMAAVRQLGP